jgi:hypothetical protein
LSDSLGQNAATILGPTKARRGPEGPRNQPTSSFRPGRIVLRMDFARCRDSLHSLARIEPAARHALSQARGCRRARQRDAICRYQFHRSARHCAAERERRQWPDHGPTVVDWRPVKYNSSGSLVSGSLAIVSWYLIDRVCFSPRPSPRRAAIRAHHRDQQYRRAARSSGGDDPVFRSAKGGALTGATHEKPKAERDARSGSCESSPALRSGRFQIEARRCRAGSAIRQSDLMRQPCPSSPGSHMNVGPAAD